MVTHSVFIIIAVIAAKAIVGNGQTTVNCEKNPYSKNSSQFQLDANCTGPAPKGWCCLCKNAKFAGSHGFYNPTTGFCTMQNLAAATSTTKAPTTTSTTKAPTTTSTAATTATTKVDCSKVMFTGTDQFKADKNCSGRNSDGWCCLCKNSSNTNTIGYYNPSTTGLCAQQQAAWASSTTKAPGTATTASGASSGTTASGATSGSTASGASSDTTASGATSGSTASGASSDTTASGATSGSTASGATSGSTASGATSGSTASGATSGSTASGSTSGSSTTAMP